jgi:hypothetical protein
MLYSNDWCRLEYLQDLINICVDITEEDIHRVSCLPLNKIKKNAVEKAYQVVGNNPVICLSGGIDSQALLNIWHEQGFPYTAITFDFGNNFNSQELNDALKFAELLQVPVKVIKLDVMRFLLRDLSTFFEKFNIISPQFAVHAYFLENIKAMGYTGAVLGGNGLLLEDNSVFFSLSDAQLLDIERYGINSKFNVLPSFLSFDKDLCIALAMETLIISRDPSPENSFYNLTYDPIIKSLIPNVNLSKEERYNSKIKSYQNLGCQLIPQDVKKTGFEEIKKFYNDQNNNEWAFEREFRLPRRYKIPESKINTIIDTNVEKVILKLSKKLNS